MYAMVCKLIIEMRGEVLKLAGHVLVPLFMILGVYLVIRSRCASLGSWIKVILNNPSMS
jgi:hypothetical protein